MVLNDYKLNLNDGCSPVVLDSIGLNIDALSAAMLDFWSRR